jgi:hypothetical protein
MRNAEFGMNTKHDNLKERTKSFALRVIRLCIFWMELLVEAKLVARDRLLDLIKEAGELVSIGVASIKTARKSK